MHIIFILESLLYFFCISSIALNILNYTSTKMRYSISLFIYTCTLLVSCLINDNLFFSLQIFFPVLQITALYFAFLNSKLNSIAYTYALYYSSNAIIALFISITNNTSHNNILWIDFAINCFTSTLCLILCFTKSKHKIKQLSEWTPKIAKRILLIVLIFSMFLLSFSLGENYNHDSNSWFIVIQKSILVVVILLLMTSTLLICIMLSNNQLKQLTANYEQQILAQAEHYKHLAESNYELRRFKHDFKNMSIAIEKLLDDEEHSEALQLFKQYNNTLEHSNGFCIMYDTGNGIADALLSDKQQKALACNCNIVFQGAIPLNHLMPTDICVILGNTLDNAIEACEKFQTKEPLTITVTCNCNSGFMFLSITNPISEKVNISNNYITTTKENKTLHGFGLYSLHSVVKKYDGKIELKSTDTTFTANIDLCFAN